MNLQPLYEARAEIQTILSGIQAAIALFERMTPGQSPGLHAPNPNGAADALPFAGSRGRQPRKQSGIIARKPRSLRGGGNLAILTQVVTALPEPFIAAQARAGIEKAGAKDFQSSFVPGTLGRWCRTGQLRRADSNKGTGFIATYCRAKWAPEPHAGKSSMKETAYREFRDGLNIGKQTEARRARERGFIRR